MKPLTPLLNRIKSGTTTEADADYIRKFLIMVSLIYAITEKHPIFYRKIRKRIEDWIRI